MESSGNEKSKMELHALSADPPPYMPPSAPMPVCVQPGIAQAPYNPGFPQPGMAQGPYTPGLPQPGMAQGPYNPGLHQPGMAQGPYNPGLHQPGMAQGPYNPGLPQPVTSYGYQPNAPPGLEYLGTLDQVFVKQKVELLEAFTGCETKNRYNILDPQGHKIFYAKEDTDCCTRQCCGSNRPFDMNLTDRNEQEVIHLQRPLACDSCCFPCCLQSIDVESPPGNVIGTVKQKWSIFIPKYDVVDETGRTVYRIEGPCFTCSCCCGDVEFEIYEAEDHSKQVGRISKQWSGLAKEYFTDADNFGIVFPPGANAKMKATLLGACMLIDFMFFEKKDNDGGVLGLLG